MSPNVVSILAKRELDGDINPEGLFHLMQNKEEWRKSLVELKRNVENNLIARKSESLNSGKDNYEAIQDFHNWKRKAVYFKSIVEKKLAEVKDMIKVDNKENNELKMGIESEQNELLKKIYNKMCVIESLLRGNPGNE